MQIEQIISGCAALFDRSLDLPNIKYFLVVIFVVLPMLRVLSSVAKTQKKVKMMGENCGESSGGNGWANYLGKSQDNNGGNFGGKSQTKLPKKLVDLVAEHGLDPNTVAVSCENDFVAMTTGFVNKKIIFSKQLVKKLTKRELESVLLHELYHFKHNHSLFLLVGEIISRTFFFFPVLKDLLINLKTEFEKKADCAAVEYQKTNKYVKRSLLKVISQEKAYEVFPQFGYHILDQRLDNLDYKKQKYLFSKKRLALSFGFLVFISVFAHLNSKYAMASKMATEMETKITCSLFECVQECVVEELSFSRASVDKAGTVPMSEINFSAE